MVKSRNLNTEIITIAITVLCHIVISNCTSICYVPLLLSLKVSNICIIESNRFGKIQ